MRGHAGGASRTRKHCKLKGKHPVRAFGKYPHSVRLFRKHLADSRCTAGRRSCLALQPHPPTHTHPPPHHPNLHSHAVLADSCAIAVHACVDTINLWAGVLTRICSGCSSVDIISLDLSFISACFMPDTHIFPPLGSR